MCVCKRVIVETRRDRERRKDGGRSGVSRCGDGLLVSCTMRMWIESTEDLSEKGAGTGQDQTWKHDVTNVRQ